jgi:hypothetical protein
LPFNAIKPDQRLLLREQEQRIANNYLMDPLVSNVICVTHVGLYAGDIYEFNGSQYLGTWNLVDNTAEIDKWDFLFGDSSDTEDEDDLVISNATFRRYRKHTGKGGDFLALTPVDLVEFPFVFPVR